MRDWRDGKEPRQRRPHRSGASSLGVGLLLLACGTACSEPGGSSDAGTSLTGSGASRSGGDTSGGSGGGRSDIKVSMDGPSSGGSNGTGGDGCQREVSLRPVALGEPQPFDLVIVADHSESLSWSRSKLATGLSDLLTHVQGREVRVFVLTPTQYGASSAAAVNSWNGEALVSFADLETGTPYAPAVTDYSAACTDQAGASLPCSALDGSSAGRLLGTWSFVMPDPVAVVRPDMSEQEFAAVQDDVTQAILALEGTGSPEEQPLCTLSRYVSQAPGVLPDNAVFLVISDEDDVSSPRDCLIGYEENWEEMVSTRLEDCASDCDGYQFIGVGTGIPRQRFQRTCTAFDDLGNPVAGTEETHDVSVGSPVGECVPRACTESEVASLQSSCDAGSQVSACEVICKSTANLNCQISLEGDFVDACTSAFTLGGRTYADLADYCDSQGIEALQSCSMLGGFSKVEEQSVMLGAFGTRPLVAGSTTDVLGTYFRSQADAVLGPTHYLVEGIVLMEDFSCAMGPGQSYADHLAAVVGDPQRLYPLCESYAPALAGVLDFAEQLIQTEYALALADNEHVTAVTLVDQNGSERPLGESDVSFDFDTQILSIEPSAVAGTDVDMHVEVTAECEPIVR